MKPYTLSDIYSKVKEAVRLWPLNPHKPTTFAVLGSFTDLDTPNLGMVVKEKDKPYFYSKAWADEQYNAGRIRWAPPGVFFFEQNGSIDVNSTSYIRYNLTLAVLDTMEMDSEKYVKDPGDQRNRMEIFEDTENVLLQVIGFLKKLDLDASEWSRQYRASFVRDNATITFERFEAGTGKLYGNYSTIVFEVPCAIEDITLRPSKGESETQAYHRSQPMPDPIPAQMVDLDKDDFLGSLDGDNLGGLDIEHNRND